MCEEGGGRGQGAIEGMKCFSHKGLTSRGREVDMKAVIIIRNTLLKLNSDQATKAQK